MRRFLTVTLALSFILISTSSVFAQARPEPTRQNTRATARCERVKARLASHAEMLRAARDRHANRIKLLRENISNLLNRLEREGIDVTQIRTDLQTLETMRQEFIDRHEGTIRDLVATGDLACAENREEFVKNVQLVRTVLNNIVDDVKAIQEFVRGTIRPNIQALRDQQSNNSRTN